MMRTRWTGLVLIPLLAAGCESNPVEHDDALVAELTLSTDHAHTLSAVGVTVTVRNEHGATVTNFDTLRVEQLAEGSTTWRTAADLALSGGSFTGDLTFASSGAYELRVQGLPTGHSEFEHIPLMAGGMTMHMEVGRSHAVVGGYRVEFENFPGHVHEGDQVAMRFWVLTAETDASGNRAPITGLEGSIDCLEADGTTESHALTVVEAGVYEATHTWTEAGAGLAKLRFTGADASPAEATFPIHVAHGH